MSYGLSQLYHKIITDPSLLTFLTYELSSLEKVILIVLKN